MDLLVANILSFFLILTRDYIIFPVIILGMVFIDRRLFLRSAVLILFGLILNIYLKSIFQVPLKAHLNQDWWAFPSGHAQFAATFYGYLAYKFRKKLVSYVCFTIIMGVCCALVYFNYHNWVDVIAALGVAALWIILFDKLDTLFKEYLFALSGILLALSYVLLSFVSKKPSTLPLILGSHIGLTIGLFLTYLTKEKFISMGKELLLIIGGAILLYGFMTILPIPKPYSLYILYSVLVGWTVAGPRLMIR